ncbi:MAG: hypothetical protein QOG45_2191 [Chloroflexota bacterium]|jgi:predicted  nucleic acid-binding Zn-ribbon protein|nr:hypothetical protein [Chloroflexota bacterium]
MNGHSVTVMTSTGGFIPGASHRATCSTCGWRGDRYAEREKADAEALHHKENAKPVVFETPTQAATDADGEAAERRHLRARVRSAAGSHDTARTEARGRIDAALGNPEHQAALDAEIDRQLAALHRPPLRP